MPEYAVHITTTARINPDDDHLWDELIERLAPYGAAFGAATPDGTGLDAQLTVDAADLHAAGRDGADAVLAVLHDLGISGEIVAVETMTAEAFEASLDDPPRPGELVSTTEAAAVLAVSRQRVLQLADRPGFPRPTRLGGGLFWPLAGLRRWRTARDRAATVR